MEVFKKVRLILDWEEANRPLQAFEKFRLMKLSSEELDDELHQLAIKYQGDRL